MSVKRRETSIAESRLKKEAQKRVVEAAAQLEEKDRQIAEQAEQIDLLKGCIMELAELILG